MSSIGYTVQPCYNEIPFVMLFYEENKILTLITEVFPANNVTLDAQKGAIFLTSGFYEVYCCSWICGR